MRSYAFQPAAADFGQWSLPALLARRNAETPDTAFLRWTHEGRNVTFGAAFDIVSHLAGAFAHRGVAREHRVALYMRNSLSHVWCWLALNAIGAVDAPINPAYSGSLLAYQIGLVRPRFLIVDVELLPRIAAIRERFDPERDVTILVNRGTDPGAAETTIANLGLLAADPYPVAPVDPTAPATVLYTSGTTGPSKGVLMPNAQMYFYSDQTVALHRMGPDDVYMAPYPLFHASARIHGVGAALAVGASCVLYDKFSARLFATRAAGSGATVTHFLGSMMTRIMEHEDEAHTRASHLRSVMALPTPHGLKDAFCARYRVANLCEVIGMTETSWPIMSPYGEPRPHGAAGLAVADWYDVRVADPDSDEEHAPGEVGELVVRPRHPWIMFTEYENAPDRTVASFRNLWFHTGDLVRRDAGGWFHYVDRLKDSIRCGGENIASYDVEQALLEFPGILDAAVVAYRQRSEEQDEEVRAFVILDGQAALDTNSLFAHLAARLPRHCCPRYVDAVGELPLTPSGKVQKALLRTRPLDGATMILVPSRVVADPA